MLINSTFYQDELNNNNSLQCNRKLAEALKIENPDISPSDINHQYSPFLLEQARLVHMCNSSVYV